ncbi:ABC transporter ATP-binding protein [Alkaliphilus hydrothermalis]|uniref:ABC-2 type transport system ATP-binding protein n=1 Tax=Alkaliphilus hydrothermalis TaxID=1482730 RepID=A0ABS2NTF7_9FIRM|nr:ABC transporter ATP-binding protein [Alkaliphilus hydrothermalis]MBM7616196.1 ABC-2 type transport system ATP-binding protein [Alkaliphilus hydrothermalis]
MEVINIEGLKRSYNTKTGVLNSKTKTTEALKGVSFNIKKGEIFGLLGPNGAGKTTIIKILATLLAPTSGTAKILGFDTYGQEKKVRPNINFIFGGERNLYWRLSARDNLLYFADLYKIDKETREKRIDYLLDLVGLTGRADEKVETYSKGMKQKLQIARGLINNPEILLLDEPTIGLDPVSSRELRNIVRTLAGKGHTILLTTHYMYEAEELCDRIAFIKNGEIVALNTVSELKKQLNQNSIIEVKVSDFSDDDISKLKSMKGVVEVSSYLKDDINNIKIVCETPLEIIKLMLEKFADKKIINLQIREFSLEDIYINLIGDGHV